jgi:hypothetical protein
MVSTPTAGHHRADVVEPVVAVNWLVVELSVASAFAFSVSTTLKKASSGEVPHVRGDGAGVGGFVRATLSHPLWLAGLVADVVGLGLQITALHLGALALVQPLLVTGLLFSLLLRHLGNWRLTHPELVWSLVLTGCLIALLALSGSVSGGPSRLTADHVPAAIAGVAGLVTAATCLTLARHARPATVRAALLGTTVGAVYAATAALIKSSSNVYTLHGLFALLTSWQLYTALALGAAGLFLTQAAFQAGPLTASLPAISTVDPLLSVAIGVFVYDEHLRRGPLAGLVLLGLLLLLATAVIRLGKVEAVAEGTAAARPP